MRAARLLLLLLAAVVPAAGAQEVCTTSAALVWKNLPFAVQRDSFVVEYDDTPNAQGIDGHTALAARSVTAYAGLAVITRFNTANRIDAYNSGLYAATTPVAYTAGQRYHFRVTVRVPTHRYTVTVTPPGGVSALLADNFRFRLGQDTVAALGYWTVYASTAASHTVCNWKLTALAAPPPSTSVTFTPQPLDFGTVDVGRSSPILSSTLTNTGAGPLNTCIGVTLPAGCQARSSMTGSSSFQYYSDNCTSLAPGASCVLQYVFVPSAGGTVTGSNVIQTTGGPFPLTFVGVGTDTAPSQPPPPGAVVATTVTIQPVEVGLVVTETQQLYGVISRSDGSADPLPGSVALAWLTWASSDPTVATVNAVGLVTARKPGTATITATNAESVAPVVGTARIVVTPQVFVSAAGFSVATLPSHPRSTFPAIPLGTGAYRVAILGAAGDTVAWFRGVVRVPGPQ